MHFDWTPRISFPDSLKVPRLPPPHYSTSKKLQKRLSGFKTTSFVISKALRILRELHEQSKAAKCSADKNYGPVIVESSILKQEYVKVLQADTYVPVTLE
eukprot:2173160-Karenia_brevis.AAC.1